MLSSRIRTSNFSLLSSSVTGEANMNFKLRVRCFPELEIQVLTSASRQPCDTEAATPP